MVLRQRLRRLVFGLLGKDPEAVVVSYFTGDGQQSLAMVEEVRRLIPDRRHYVAGIGLSQEIPGVTTVSLSPGSACSLYRQLPRRFSALRIGLAPVLFTAEKDYSSLRRAAWLLAPGKILAYNSRGERYHPRLRCAISSWLFLRGVPLDRIHLRPWWLFPWKRDRTIVASDYKILDGRPLSAYRPRVAVLTPYFPYPLSHGGAVRIFNLLREAAREFDLFLFAFTEQAELPETARRSNFAQRPSWRRSPVIGNHGGPVWRLRRSANTAPQSCGEFWRISSATTISSFLRSNAPNWPNTAATFWWNTI